MFGPATVVPEGFTLRVSGHGVQRRITLAGELDLCRTAQLEHAVRGVCKDGAQGLELDMGAVTFIDSTGVGGILNANRHCGERRCALSIVPSSHPGPRRVFEMLGLKDVLPWRGRSADK